MDIAFIIKTDGLGAYVLCDAEGIEIMKSEASANRAEAEEDLNFLVHCWLDYVEAGG
mgnify:CR=1 FL=1